MTRRAQLFTAIQNRIGRVGDDHIRLRGETFREVLLACGFDWDTMDTACYRQIDAAALEALIRLAKP